MRAIKITISGKSFLLPDGHNYEFPKYIQQHLDLVRDYISAGEEIIFAMQNYGSIDSDNSEKKARLLRQELSEFKERTGIIGTPFDLRDVDAFITANSVDVLSVTNMDEL